jgi:hypothetical protein
MQFDNPKGRGDYVARFVLLFNQLQNKTLLTNGETLTDPYVISSCNWMDIG